MITTGYISVNAKKIHYDLICGYCRKFLGNYDIVNQKEYDDTEGWEYCPYCGNELQKEYGGLTFQFDSRYFRGGWYE